MNEAVTVRRFLYLGFAVCSILLVVTLSLGAEWRAALVGTVVYGVPAYLVYQREQDRAENANTVKTAAVQRTRGLQIADQDDEPADRR